MTIVDIDYDANWRPTTATMPTTTTNSGGVGTGSAGGTGGAATTSVASSSGNAMRNANQCTRVGCGQTFRSQGMSLLVNISEISAVQSFLRQLGCDTCTMAQSSSDICVNTFVDCRDEFVGEKYALFLANRNLTGYIDGTSFAQMPNCYRLELADNALSGTLPTTIFDSLTVNKLYLNISNNFISGVLPPNPRGNAHKLGLNNNRLSGPIPLAYFSLPRMQQLFLNRNLFSGALPTPPLNSSRLIDFFDARSNLLSGTIASQWNRLPNLRFFLVSNNVLTGTLASALFLAPLTDWAEFHVANNSLSGTVPSQLGALKLMRRLDLALNNFSGPLVLPPTSTTFCRVVAEQPMERNAFSQCSGNPACCILLPTTTSAMPTSQSQSLVSTLATEMTSGTLTLATSASTSAVAIQSPIDSTMIGGVVGGCALLTVVLALALWLKRRASRRQQHVSAVPMTTEPRYSNAPPSAHDHYSSFPAESSYGAAPPAQNYSLAPAAPNAYGESSLSNLE